MKVNRKQLNSGGRNCLNAELEEEVAFWVYNMCQKMLHVSHKLIIFDDKSTDPASSYAFVASRGLCEKIMRRHGYGKKQQLRRKIFYI